MTHDRAKEWNAEFACMFSSCVLRDVESLSPSFAVLPVPTIFSDFAEIGVATAVIGGVEKINNEEPLTHDPFITPSPPPHDQNKLLFHRHGSS